MKPPFDVVQQEARKLVDLLNDSQPRAAHEIGGVFHRALLKLAEAQVSEGIRQLFLYDVCLWFLRPREAMMRQHEGKVVRLEERFGDEGKSETFLPYNSLSHFETQFENFENPFLKARYADFLATRAASKDRGAARAWVQKAVPNYLQAVTVLSVADDVNYQIEVFKALDSAAHLALCRAPDLLISIVSALRTYLEQAASTSSKEDEYNVPVGRWTVEAGWILINLRTQKPDSISDTDLIWWEEKAVELAQLNSKNEPILEQGFWMQAAEAACLRSDVTTRFAHLHEFANAKVREAYARAQEPGASFLTAAALMEDAVDQFDRLRSHDVLSNQKRDEIREKVRRLKLEIRRFYREGEKELGVISTPLNITREQIESVIEPFLEPATLEECLQRLGSSLIPDAQRAEQWADSQQDNDSLMSLVGISVLGDGMNLGSYNSDQARRTVDFNRLIDNEIDLNSTLFLPRIFARLSAEKGLSPQTLGFVA